MNEDELRGLVREAVERHLGRPAKEYRVPVSPDPSQQGTRTLFDHSSHRLLRVVAGSEVDDGSCVIEPAVRCNHCGFCQSFGH